MARNGETFLRTCIDQYLSHDGKKIYFSCSPFAFFHGRFFEIACFRVCLVFLLPLGRDHSIGRRRRRQPRRIKRNCRGFVGCSSCGLSLARTYVLSRRLHERFLKS